MKILSIPKAVASLAAKLGGSAKSTIAIML